MIFDIKLMIESVLSSYLDLDRFLDGGDRSLPPPKPLPPPNPLSRDAPPPNPPPLPNRV